MMSFFFSPGKCLDVPLSLGHSDLSAQHFPG